MAPDGTRQYMSYLRLKEKYEHDAQGDYPELVVQGKEVLSRCCNQPFPRRALDLSHPRVYPSPPQKTPPPAWGWVATHLGPRQGPACSGPDRVPRRVLDLPQPRVYPPPFESPPPLPPGDGYDIPPKISLSFLAEVHNLSILPYDKQRSPIPQAWS